MANIAVQKIAEEKSLSDSWLAAIQKFSERVRAKAFDLFERSDRQHGHDVDQWLEAEEELLAAPSCEVKDTGAGYEARIDTPGFDAQQIEVSALPDSILVKAEASEKKEETKDDVRYTELRDQYLFRRILLSKPIDVNTVTAKLEKGVLQIIAKKKATEKTSGAAA